MGCLTRTLDRTNRLLDDARKRIQELEVRLDRLEHAFEIAYPGRFLPDGRRAVEAGTRKLY